jgi:hypothetical protein
MSKQSIVLCLAVLSFNLENDEEESDDLVEDLPVVTEPLKNQLDNWLEENVTRYPVPNPEYN